MEMVGGSFYRLGFLMRGQDFPDGKAVTGQVRFTPGEAVPEGDAGNSISRLFSMTYRATRSLFEVLAARACLVTIGRTLRHGGVTQKDEPAVLCATGPTASTDAR
jgi:hypothetical protein